MRAREPETEMAVSQERDDTMMINERSVNYSKGRRVHKVVIVAISKVCGGQGHT